MINGPKAMSKFPHSTGPGGREGDRDVVQRLLPHLVGPPQRDLVRRRRGQQRGLADPLAGCELA